MLMVMKPKFSLEITGGIVGLKEARSHATITIEVEASTAQEVGEIAAQLQMALKEGLEDPAITKIEMLPYVRRS